jgi:hypothetical protein
MSVRLWERHLAAMRSIEAMASIRILPGILIQQDRRGRGEGAAAADAAA